MNNKLKKILKSSFNAPTTSRKYEFLNSLTFKKSSCLEFLLSQICYIRKRFWALSILVLICMIILSMFFKEGKDMLAIVSASLPLLTLISIAEINKSTSFNMSELETSCRYNLEKIILIRLSTIGTYHFIILLIAVLIFKEQSQYGMFRYILYSITPFMLSSYLSLWVTNHVKSKDALYICSGIIAFISMAILEINSKIIYEGDYVLFWLIIFISITILLIKEIYFLLKERNERWNFA